MRSRLVILIGVSLLLFGCEFQETTAANRHPKNDLWPGSDERIICVEGNLIWVMLYSQTGLRQGQAGLTSQIIGVCENESSSY